MKYFESSFEEYINTCQENNFHPKLLKTYEKIGKDFTNVIFYGSPGSGKYTQVLYYLSILSQSSLKYEKRVCVNYNKDDYYYKISDIHIEIDMELLGCNAKSLWNVIYDQVIDIVNTKINQPFIILCKNFDKVHTELMQIFYSYMQNNVINKVSYILICENLCFIPNNILDRCNIISVPRPSSLSIKKHFGSNNNYLNLKNNYNKDNNISNEKICKLVVNNSSNFTELRENIYNILVYNQNEGECIYEILRILSKEKNKNFSDIYDKIYSFFKLYNNNYRPIYHLEKLILSIV